MTHSVEHFLGWLRDAHAMEVQATGLLRGQINRIESYPELTQKLQQHLAETEAQVESLGTLLDRSDRGRPVLRDLTGRISAAAQGMGSVFSGDEVVKTTMAAYAFEHNEIALYRVLIAAADEIGDSEARDVLQRILSEEVAMAAWLETHLDVITRLYLMRDERDLQAKR
ncbi:ferritin-like domain-containing protein [Rhizobium sp. SSA_523]|uniref:ferritin-like domain-containing protein n=1 Tax=Rhizobium sp. SSA_523 TaxID=2952477 RepID=UPI002090DA79|nr:DUF892 family protein [Rhizobium sp. SSA_523]MCO5731710.1 ferritin-like domain-containing protein [Rhizobium sp. SSA_523]WKC22914.1 DUF892 family protein [Rhizobium sp. SSA_523]